MKISNISTGATATTSNTASSATITMASKLPPPRGPDDDDDDNHDNLETSESSTTHHQPSWYPRTIKEDEDENEVDETSTTHHAPSIMKDTKDAIEGSESSLAKLGRGIAESALAKQQQDKQLQDKQQPFKAKEKDVQSVDEISLCIHKRVAEIAAQAYSAASAQSHVLSKTKLRDIALIRLEELEAGTFLGKGSFSNVYEISKICILNKSEDHDDEDNECGEKCSNCEPRNSAAYTPNGTLVTTNSGTMKKQVSIRETNDNMEQQQKFASSRKLLASSYRRSECGTYRYAIKYLKEDIRNDAHKYAVGTSDLVIEGMFLASLTHPNIIKVRALPEGGVASLVNYDTTAPAGTANDDTNTCNNNGGGGPKGYFLILDRLFDTLGDKIYGVWGHSHNVKKDWLGGRYRSPKNKLQRRMHLAERLRVAFDVSAALKFLHSKSIVYRDLKPENLGFDVRGDVKLFDLGLVKELLPQNQDRQGNYKLSMAGTPRYMAPEVGRYQPYNLSVDVYSLSMLLYEIITLEKPFKKWTYTQLKEKIFRDGHRPPMKLDNGAKVWPKSMRNLIHAGWSQNPKKRPSMDDMYEQLKVAYVTLGKVAVEEVSHNRRRSTFVATSMSKMSVRHLTNINGVK